MVQQFSFGHVMQAFGRLTWMQHRKIMLQCAAGTGAAIVLTLLTTLIPGTAHTRGILGMSPFAIPIAMFLFMGMYSVSMKLGGMLNADDPMAMMRGSMAPMFTLPIKTHHLVLGPLTVRALCIAGLWLAYCVFAAIPTNSGVPVVLSTLILIQSLAFFQASSWLIRTRGCLGLFFMFGAMFAPIIAAFAVLRHVPQVLLESGSVGLILFAAWCTLRAAPIARHSESTSGQTRLIEKARAKDVLQAAKPDGAVLTSAFKAQVWFRMKQRLPLVVSMVAAMMLFILIVLKSLAGPVLGLLLPSAGSGSSPFSLGPLPMVFALFMVVLVLFMPLDNQGAIREGKFVMNSGLDPFLSIRPITTATLTLAKLSTTMVGACWLTLVFIVGGVLWCITPGSSDIDLSRLFVGDTLLRRGLLIAAFIAFSPILIASIQFLTATGTLLPQKLKKLGKFVFPVSIWVLFTGGMLIFRPGIPGRSLVSLDFVGPLLINVGLVLFAFKAALALYASISLHKRRLLDSDISSRCFGVWAVAWVALTSLFYYLLPAGSTSLLAVALIVALILPANRILWHISLLDKTRHV